MHCICIRNLCKISGLKDWHSCLIKLRPLSVTAKCHQDLEPAENVQPTHSHASLPIITSRQIEYPNRCIPAKQAWLESLSQYEDEKLGIVDLHPDIFGTYPRIDILHRNVIWQKKYKAISYEKTETRAERRGGGRKPWPQKGLGRARHGSIRSPIWKGGGIAMGPRGPQSYFYMLPTPIRCLGLRVALSVKYAQNDLHIVDSLEIPSDEPEYLRDLVDTRFWGFSVLFIDDTDVISRNIALALNKIPEFNVMPVYGLNVHSMLKHETLVITLAALNKIEEKLIYQLRKAGKEAKFRTPRVSTLDKMDFKEDPSALRNITWRDIE